MIYNIQSKENKFKFKRMLNGAASISSISTSSKTPRIDWRLAEVIFCKSFNAKDEASRDRSIDAILDLNGIGIKTFQGGSVQKIAEFNDKNKYPFNSQNLLEIAKEVSSYRNERLKNDKKYYNLNSFNYLLIYRSKDKTVSIHEEQMNEIDINNIILLNSKNEHIVKFSDNKNNYSFNITKSTLYKEFDLSNPLESFIYNFNKDDIDFLLNSYKKTKIEPVDEIILPLFSEKNGRVGQKSGLNGWNAAGRKRHSDEIYLPIPIRIHKENPNFFPRRDEPFSLETDDGEKFLAKMCQDNSKALMSNPNRAIGKWILRDQLKIEYNVIVTKEMLLQKKITHFKLCKYDNENYSIELTTIK